MSTTCQIARTGFGRHRAALVASASALLLSAWLTAVAIRVPSPHWLGCLSFLLLFTIIRRLRPGAASLAGGVWGGCLYAFCLARPASTINTLAFMIGPNMLLLALGWTSVEGVLHFHNLFHPREGLSLRAPSPRCFLTSNAGLS